MISNVNAVRKSNANCEEDVEFEHLLCLDDFFESNFDSASPLVIPEEDGLDDEVVHIEDQSLEKGFNLKSIGKLTLESNRNTKICNQYYSNVNSSTFQTSLESELKNLMTVTKYQYKKKDLRKILFQHVTDNLDWSWNECTNHDTTLKNSFLNILVDKFLYAWCYTQNLAMKEASKSTKKRDGATNQKLSKQVQMRGKKSKKTLPSSIQGITTKTICSTNDHDDISVPDLNISTSGDHNETSVPDPNTLTITNKLVLNELPIQDLSRTIICNSNDSHEMLVSL